MAVGLAARLRTWIWLLIYGGMIGFGLGLSLQRRDDTLGWGLVSVSVVAVIVGVVLIWYRSRLNDNETQR